MVFLVDIVLEHQKYHVANGIVKFNDVTSMNDDTSIVLVLVVAGNDFILLLLLILFSFSHQIT